MKPPALRNTKKNGAVYKRRPDIEQLIDDLTQLAESDLVQRCQFKSGNKQCVPDEALFHLVRRSVGTAVTQKRLFDVFANRLRRYRYDTLQERFRDATLEEAFDRMMVVLADDRTHYQLRLDIYEVAFHRAYACLVVDALRSVQGQIESTDALDETLEAKLEADGFGDDAHADSVFDLVEQDDRWTRALGALSERQRKVVIMVVEGFAIDPSDPKEPSIPSILGISKRTASSELAKARQIIQQFVKEGDKV